VAGSGGRVRDRRPGRGVRDRRHRGRDARRAHRPGRHGPRPAHVPGRRVDGALPRPRQRLGGRGSAARRGRGRAAGGADRRRRAPAAHGGGEADHAGGGRRRGRPGGTGARRAGRPRRRRRRAARGPRVAPAPRRARVGRDGDVARARARAGRRARGGRRVRAARAGGSVAEPAGGARAGSGSSPAPTGSEAVPLVVAADGGLRHAVDLGLRPDLLVGDMDSVTARALDAFPALPTERHPTAKDELDLELALAAARRLGATSARVLGAFGGRLDHSLATLLVAARLAAAEPAFPVSLHGGPHAARVCTPALPATLAVRPGTTVSLLALSGDAVASATGLAYPVVGLRLPFGAGLGVSNVATGESVDVLCASGAV